MLDAGDDLSILKLVIRLEHPVFELCACTRNCEGRAITFEDGRALCGAEQYDRSDPTWFEVVVEHVVFKYGEVAHEVSRACHHVILPFRCLVDYQIHFLAWREL